MLFLSVLPLGSATSHGQSIGFGFGGPTIGLFTVDLSTVNAVLVDNGYGPLDGELITFGGGGGGGVSRGFSVGGTGWGGSVASLQGDRKAELSLGLGGVDIAYVLGGTERALLSLGAVLGGGGLDLELRDRFPESFEDAVATPTTTTLSRSFFAAEPYVSIHIQPSFWLGVAMRAGYLLTLPDHWTEGGREITGPSLDIAGPHISVSIAFGGIAKMDIKSTIEEAIQSAESLGVKTAQEAVDAAKAGDLEPLAQWLAEDITWVTPPGLPWSGTWVGKQAVLGAAASIQGTDLVIDDVVTCLDGRVTITWHFTAQESGQAIQGMTVCRVVNGKVISAHDYQG
jgi:ketosteroid isomerase-like protein